MIFGEKVPFLSRPDRTEGVSPAGVCGKGPRDQENSQCAGPEYLRNSKETSVMGPRERGGGGSRDKAREGSKGPDSLQVTQDLRLYSR